MNNFLNNLSLLILAMRMAGLHAMLFSKIQQ